MTISTIIDHLVQQHRDAMIDLPDDDMDFSERFQAVVGQKILLSIGLHSNQTRNVWQFEIAELSEHWYAEGGEQLPYRDYRFSAGFPDFDHAMAALCDATRLLSSTPEFANV